MTGLIPLLLLLPTLALVAGAAGASEGSDDGAQFPGQPGAVNATAGGFEGVYTSGSLPQEGAILADFAVAGTPLLQSVSITGYERSERNIEGSSVEVQGTHGQLEVSDTPAAYMTVEIQAGATATVVPDAQATVTGAGSSSFRVASGSVAGLLWAECRGAQLHLDNGSLVLGPSTDGCQLHFRADSGSSPIGQADIDDALSGGHLAAEVTVEGDGHYSVRHVASFEPVEVQVQAADGRVVVAVSGNVTGPRSVMILLPDQVLPNDDSVTATFDGHPMDQAPSTQAALSGASTGANGSYARASAAGVEAVVLSVPSFSVHLVELFVPGAAALGGIQPIALGDAALPVALAAVATVGAAAVLVRRPGK